MSQDNVDAAAEENPFETVMETAKRTFASYNRAIRPQIITVYDDFYYHVYLASREKAQEQTRERVKELQKIIEYSIKALKQRDMMAAASTIEDMLVEALKEST